MGTVHSITALGAPCTLHSTPQAPAKEETGEVMERLKDSGILIGKGGLYGNVFRIKPPMCFSLQVSGCGHGYGQVSSFALVGGRLSGCRRAW